jgi:menaquinone-dependent protoporphyrinogen oxidase
MTGLILIAYATKHGSTREVADSLADALREQELDVETQPASFVDDLSPYAGVVVGGSLYTGRWHPDALGFVKRHRRALASMPVAVFAMGPRTMDAGEVAESRTQLGRALAKVPDIDSCAVAIFGGVVDPRKLRFPFNRMPATDARDWDAIRAWAQDVACAFGFGKPASDPRDLRSELQRSPR